MKTATRFLALGCMFCLSAVAPVFGLGPVDGEVSAVWWANDFESSTETATTSEDAGAPGLRAELWLMERYGMRASQFGSDTDDTDGADYTSVDFMWRALSPTENNFVAVGLGWQQMDMEGLAEDISGMRVAVEGRISLAGMLYGYGHGAYMPSMDDVDASNPLAGAFTDIDAYEYELGVAWNAMPFMDVHAGYRVNNVSFTQETFTTSGISGGFETPQTNGAGVTSQMGPGAGSECPDCAPAAVIAEGGETESSGLFVGVGFHF